MSRRKVDPQDAIRRRVTDPSQIAAFTDRVREGLRREYPEATEDEIAEWMANGRPATVWATIRERRDGSRVTTAYDHGTARSPEELAALRRRLPGGANRGGRTDERERRLADYRAAILALTEAGYREAAITARAIVDKLNRTGSEAQLRKDLAAVGGLKQFRQEVLRSRLSGR